MSWLAQNWVWVVIGVAIAWFALRGGLGRLGGHAGGHGGGTLGGMGHGGHGAGHGGHGGETAERPPANAPEAALDPVSGEAVRTAHAVTSMHEGKIYYFASKENRERFEAAPQEYAHKAAGHPIRSAAVERPRRRGGC